MVINDEHMDIEQEPVKEHGKDLTKGSIPRLLFLFSLPFLIGNALQAGYSIVNRIWVGKYLGEDALAAATTTMSAAFIFIALANGLTLGASILIAQFTGAKNWSGVKRVVQSSVVLTAVLSLVLCAVGEIFAGALLQAMHTEHDVLPLATGYMRLFLISFPLMSLAFLTTSLMRGVGDSFTPLIFQAVGVTLTAVLDPFLMLGWLGFPRLGLNGTAIAALIAQTLVIIAFFVYLHLKDHIVSPDWRRLSIDWPMSQVMLKISAPASLQQLLVSIGMAGVIVIINRFGKAATAGFGVASTIDMAAFMIALAFSMAISMLAGQNIGAKRYDRVKQVYYWGLLMSGGTVLTISLVAVFFPQALMGMFVKPQEDPEVYRAGLNYLRIVGPSYIIFAVMFVGVGIINGAGHTLATTLMTLLGLWLIRLPLASWLSNKMHRVEGVWYALVISFTVSMLLSLIYYYSGLWKRPIVHAKPQPPTHDPEPAAGC